jgi:putative membrane protein
MYPHREAPFHTGWWSVERLIPILLLLLLIAVIVWAVVRITRQPSLATGGTHGAAPVRSSSLPVPDPALDLVRQRYARGEVDRETFLQTVRDLSPGSVEVVVPDPPPTDAA